MQKIQLDFKIFYFNPMVSAHTNDSQAKMFSIVYPVTEASYLQCQTTVNINIKETNGEYKTYNILVL